MENTKQYLKLTLNSTKWKTVKDFLNEKYGIVTNLSIYDFLVYDAGEGVKNIDRIVSKYTEQFKERYRETVSILLSQKEIANLPINTTKYEDLPIINSPEVYIPNGSCDTGLVQIRGINQFLEQKNIVGFWSQKLKEIITDENYVRSENIIIDGSGLTVEIVNQNVQVWVWCRALNKIINLSPFVESMSISKSDVGNFNLSLVPVKSIDSVMGLDNEDTISYFNLRDKNHQHQIDFFHSNLQQNDIVFMRFERLKSEKPNSSLPYFDFEISKSRLPGQIWDMIGLIDASSAMTNFGNSDYSVTVTGRDLLKLLVEDGSYFLQLAYIQSANDSFIATIDPEDKWFKRNYSGQFDPNTYDFLNGARRIDDSIGFIINQLSNLGVLGEDAKDLFSAYKTKRSTVYKITGADANEIKKHTVEGIWQIIKIMIDEQLEKRVLVDSSSVSQDATILDQFQKVCQEPFVEFFGDTYGDEFNFIVRQPPFNRESIMSFLKTSFLSDSSLKHNENPVSVPKNSVSLSEIVIVGRARDSIIDIEEKDLLNFNLQWDETYYSWYQIKPNTDYVGQNDIMTGGMIPIVYFSKITETFGNHRKIVVDNYLSPDLSAGASYAVDVDNYRRALLNDLKFIIDTNIYLPFTRKGTITLAKGDRRIKKGTFIRLVPTGEICYVDSVTNDVRFTSQQIDRGTTINVSRCMIEEYIKGAVGYDHNGQIIKEGGKNITFSYFDIVDTSLIVKNLLQVDSNSSILPQQNYVLRSSVNSEYSVTIPEKSRIAYVHNNPGNLMYVKQPNATPGEVKSKSDKTYYWAKFTTPESGFEALIRQIGIYAGRGLSVKDTISVYAPSFENETDKYIQSVCSSLGYLPNTLIKDTDHFLVAQKIAQIESNSIVNKRDVSGVQKIINDAKTPSSVLEQPTAMINNKKMDSFNFGLNDIQFDFFQKRQQLNLRKR